MSLREGETGVVWRTRRRCRRSQKGAGLGKHPAVLVARLAAADRSQPPRQDVRCVRPFASPPASAVGFLTGIHGLQFMLIVGLLLTLGARWLDPRHRVALVWTGALSYLGLIVLLECQTLRGPSVARPDGAPILAVPLPAPL